MIYYSEILVDGPQFDDSVSELRQISGDGLVQHMAPQCDVQ